MTLDRRPDDARDDLVEAVGRLSEAFEMIERARGRLYDFHQLTGRADAAIGDAVDRLEAAGATEQAERIRDELVGRNVLSGRWTFQVVEEYDDGYYATARRLVEDVRDELMDGRSHVFEAEMKARRITPEHPDHAPTPED